MSETTVSKVECTRSRNAWGWILAFIAGLLFLVLVIALTGRQIERQVFCAVSIVSAVSLVGVCSFALQRKSLARVLNGGVAVAVGILAGDALIHLVPDAIANGVSPMRIGVGVGAGWLSLWAIQLVIARANKAKNSAPAALFADGLHNSIDGVVVAVAFMASPSLGISTTFAVAAHEIPHELANFAILMASGYSRRRALLYNVLGSLPAFFGAAAALAVGKNSADLSASAMPFIAGSFLFLAFGVLAPEVSWREGRLSLTKIGLSVGGAVLMLLLRSAE